ncbi:hypothetical protein ZHAS_00009661 [Anopheles sinensis]|uniref:Uncharacterized protein n=1 Tax=Anopheles sinensis TaxID=74873 RepID=A0A084VV28_ANOSI|nr:hypothetical protein ZHAS_00009661 [Anopheles sinensis]
MFNVMGRWAANKAPSFELCLLFSACCEPKRPTVNEHAALRGFSRGGGPTRPKRRMCESEDASASASEKGELDNRVGTTDGPIKPSAHDTTADEWTSPKCNRQRADGARLLEKLRGDGQIFHPLRRADGKRKPKRQPVDDG